METAARGLEARIAQAVAVVDGVGTVALFGSHATNRARPDSDLDVAVLPTKADPACRRRLVSRVAAALACSGTPRPGDLRRGGSVVDRDVLSTRLNALEGI